VDEPFTLSKTSLIFWADSLLCCASFLISFATTENPLPSFPALAASIAALSPNKFVCEAILSIKSIISVVLPIFF
jgi:hypothetical protein